MFGSTLHWPFKWTGNSPGNLQLYLRGKTIPVGQLKTRWANSPQEEPCEVFALHVNKVHVGFDTGTVCRGLTGIYQTCLSGGDKARRQQE